MYKKTMKNILSLVLAFAMLATGSAFAADTSVVDPSAISASELAPLDLSDVIADLNSEFSPLEIPDTDTEQWQTIQANLPVIDADSIDEKSDFDLSFSDIQSENDRVTMNSPASTARAGRLPIDPNTMYTHSLSSASDYWEYQTQVPSGGHATAFLDSSSAMDFYLEMVVYDSSGAFKYFDTSEVSRSIYQGQRVRLPVVAGDFVVIYIAKSDNSNFVANSYNLGVIVNNADASEPNEQPQDALNLGTAGTATVWSSSLDNSFDVDWFTFTHNDVARLPRVAFAASSTDIHASVYKMVNGTLSKVTDIANTGSWTTINNNANTTYYMVVYSKNLGAGSYQIGTGASLIYLLDGRVIVDLSKAGGDTSSPTSFGSGGSRPTVRRNTTGTITLSDSRGNPIQSLQYQIGVYTIYYGASGNPGLIGYSTYTTNASGTGSAYTDIELWPTSSPLFFNVGGYSYCPARISVILPTGLTAELKFGGPSGGIAPTGYAYIDAWHYGGYIAT